MTASRKIYKFHHFRLHPDDAPMLEKMTEQQQYVLTTSDNTMQQMAYMKCAEGTVKSRRNRARRALLKMHEDAAHDAQNDVVDNGPAGSGLDSGD